MPRPARAGGAAVIGRDLHRTRGVVEQAIFEQDVADLTRGVGPSLDLHGGVAKKRAVPVRNVGDKAVRQTFHKQTPVRNTANSTN